MRVDISGRKSTRRFDDVISMVGFIECFIGNSLE